MSSYAVHKPSNLIKSFLGEGRNRRDRLIVDTEHEDVISQLIDEGESCEMVCVAKNRDGLESIVSFAVEAARYAAELSPGESLVWLTDEDERHATLFYVSNIAEFNEERERIARDFARENAKEGMSY